MLTAGRLRLILVNPNTLGHYCALMAPIVIWVLFEGPGQIRRVWRWGALGLLFLSLVWSGSRGALITTLMALTLQFVLSYRKKLFWLFFSVAFIASAHALMGDPTSRPGDETTFIEQNVIRQNSLFTGSGRSGIWEAARNLVRKRPVFGYGFASVDRLFQLGYFPELQEFQGGHVHNSYL